VKTILIEDYFTDACELFKPKVRCMQTNARYTSPDRKLTV